MYFVREDFERMKALAISFLLVACIFNSHNHCQSKPMKAGNYDLCFLLQGEELHIPLKIVNDSLWEIMNHEEQINLQVVPDISSNNDEFIAELPFFRTRLRGEWNDDFVALGYWEDMSRDSSYWVRFTISPASLEAKVPSKNCETKKYKVVFQNHSDTSEAHGQFTFCDRRITGTFMTETGDYRHLHGVVSGNELQFGTFDGAHLYFFKAQLHSDSIHDGIFLSGNKWRQSWTAVRDEKYSLRDPNYIVRPSGEPISNLSVTDANGNEISLSSTFFQSRVTVIEVMGTWCPNCLDASRFLDTLENEIRDTAMRVLPLLFERGDSFAQWSAAAKRFFATRDVQPHYFFGGKASKKTAAGLFPSLAEILAFPTLIIVDRQGKIAWVHSGFYGPGTGEYYEKNKHTLKSVILSLLR
jgi:thiol-disulfide isomerase/thioredoxin